MKPRIVDHFERKAPESRSPGDPRLLRRVTAHVQRHLGRVDLVFHDLLSDVVHVDLLWVEPGPQRDFHVFVTCGMSERPMPVADPRCECRYAELLLRLPANWPLEPHTSGSEPAMWPLLELVHLARAPHIFETHIWGGHTFANADRDGRPEPLSPATGFCGTVLAEPAWTPRRFRSLHLAPRRRIRFFSVVPLHCEELLLAREHGTDALFRHLEHAGVTDLLDIERPNLLASPN